MREDEPVGDRGALEPLYSQLPDDAEAANLVAFFVGDVQRCIEAIERAWNEREYGELRSLAQRLKGAGSGYGYPAITERAAELEHLVQSTEAESSAIRERVEALIHLCRRACHDGPRNV